LNAKSIVARVRGVFEGLPEHRRGGNNQSYTIADAALSAFSVFFTQSPSFLDYQVRMQKQRGRNNARSLFGVHEIPSANQIRNLLDPIPQDSLYPLMAEVGESLLQHTGLQNWRSINGHVLIALDGTDSFSSEKISCPCCSRQSLKDGKTRYRHTVVTPVLVAPGQERVVPLPPEFIQPQDGHDKQDCELAASSRWLNRWAPRYAPWGATLLGDDLYCHQPFCEQVLAQGMDFIFTCKPGSHALLTEWVDDFARSGQVQTLTRSHWNGRHRLTDTYRYVNQVPLRDSDDALLVNWCELTTTDEAGQILYRNAWATSHRIEHGNVQTIATAGRTRWKIENEGNNTLKTQGYHFEHNFGHGKQHLSNLLTTMILLAYLLHTTLDLLDTSYRSIRGLLPSRRTFFEHLRALLQYFPFDTWEHLMAFMLDGLASPPPATG
jgi:hypothetical protein